MRIFYRSGSRSTEMLALKADKVDLELQEFTILVKKGKQYKEDIRPIPDDILALWVEMLAEAKPGEYLFSVGFKPGARKIGKDNVPKRWKKYVKNNLGINKDFYSLKHKNLDKISDQLSFEDAQAAAGHTSATTTKGYTVGEESRQRDKLKKVRIDF